MPGVQEPLADQPDEAFAGKTSRAKMIPMFSKTLNIGTVAAMGILNQDIHDTATDINAEKMNCAEDRQKFGTVV